MLKPLPGLAVLQQGVFYLQREAFLSKRAIGRDKKNLSGCFKRPEIEQVVNSLDEDSSANSAC